MEVIFHKNVFVGRQIEVTKDLRKTSWKNNVMVKLLVMRLTTGILAIVMKTGGQRGETEQEGGTVCPCRSPFQDMAHLP